MSIEYGLIWGLLVVFLVDIYVAWSFHNVDDDGIGRRNQSHSRSAVASAPNVQQTHAQNNTVPFQTDFSDTHDDSVLRILQSAGVTHLDEATIRRLPTVSQVGALYGPQPVILGLDRCPEYRRAVPADRRMLGAAGMFSTGTNLVTHLLKRNCYIPERAALYGPKATKVCLLIAVTEIGKRATHTLFLFLCSHQEQLGMRWQVRKSFTVSVLKARCMNRSTTHISN